jgi:hypothetical protein
MGRYDLEDAVRLVERKKAGERIGLEPALLEEWRPRIDSLFTRLDAAQERSLLPQEPPNAREVRDWLLAIRRSRLPPAPAAAEALQR